MFGIGMTELLVILAVVLIVFGPTRLPELARSLGRALGEFRHASNDLRRTIQEAAEEPRIHPQAKKPEATPPPPTPPPTVASGDEAGGVEEAKADATAPAKK